MAPVGSFAIVRALDKTAVLSTFEATDEGGRAVRLRVLDAKLGLDEEARARFDGELAHVASVRHPGLDRPLGWGLGEPLHVATALAPGVPLGVVCDRAPGGRIGVELAVCVGTEVALALHAAHASSVVHAGVSLRCVLLGVDGRARLTDFGLMRLLHARLAADPAILRDAIEGLAPEQVAEGGEVGPATDVFALGLLLYRILTGKSAFAAPSALAMSIRLSIGKPTPITSHGVEIDAEVRELVMNMLSAAPADRPAMEQVARTLEKRATRRELARQQIAAAVRAALPAADPVEPPAEEASEPQSSLRPPLGVALTSVEMDAPVEVAGLGAGAAITIDALSWPDHDAFREDIRREDISLDAPTTRPDLDLREEYPRDDAATRFELRAPPTSEESALDEEPARDTWLAQEVGDSTAPWIAGARDPVAGGTLILEAPRDRGLGGSSDAAAPELAREAPGSWLRAWLAAHREGWRLWGAVTVGALALLVCTTLLVVLVTR